MRVAFLIANIFAAFWTAFNQLAEVNDLKMQAETLYRSKNFKQCIVIYDKILRDYNEVDEAMVLNLAHSHAELREYNSALNHYKDLLKSTNPVIRSKAYLQIGVIYSYNGKKEVGINYFKEALKANPANETARYNYKLLKKEQAAQPKEASQTQKRENNQGKNKSTAQTNMQEQYSDSGEERESNNAGEEPSGGDSESSGGEDEELEYQDGGKKETDALTSQRLGELGLSEQQAKAILQSMKNNEIQYWQQRKRASSSKAVPGKPNW